MGLLHYEFRRTTWLLAFCCAVLTGLCLGYFWIGPRLGAGLLIVLVIAVGARHKLLGIAAIAGLGLVIGWARGNVLMDQLASYDNLYDQKVELQVTANEDAVYGKNGQLTFVASGIQNLATGQKLPGKISVSGMGLNAVYQADVVVVSGKLRAGIGAYEGFMSYAQLELYERNPSLIATLRRNFAAAMQNALPEPTASFGMGILIGQRATLPDDVKDNLQKVGLTHIIAVSGANLTIMLDASRRILGKKSKRLSMILTVLLMGLFVLLTGGSASIIRAAYVSALSMLATYYGHRARPLLLIGMVAAATAYINPIYVWRDASWYLSFLAFYGVLMLSPLFQNRLPSIVTRSIILSVGLESICAEIMSVPYILYTFGQMSFMGLPANILVVALIPLAMLLSFIAGLAGMLLLPVCGWFAWPAKLLLTYMLDTAHVLASVPHIFVDHIGMTTTGLVVLYGVIACMTLLLTFKDSNKSAIITDKKTLDSS